VTTPFKLRQYLIYNIIFEGKESCIELEISGGGKRIQHNTVNKVVTQNFREIWDMVGNGGGKDFFQSSKVLDKI